MEVRDKTARLILEQQAEIERLRAALAEQRTKWCDRCGQNVKLEWVQEHNCQYFDCPTEADTLTIEEA